MFLSFLSLLQIVLAVPSPQTTPVPIMPDPLPFGEGTNFKLVAQVQHGDFKPSIKNWELSSYHVAPCLDYAVLSKPGKGRTFYANGTATELQSKQGDLLSDGNTPPTPYGFIIPKQNETEDGRRPVSINCGAGTPGVGVTFPPIKQPQVAQLSYSVGSFFACNKTLPYGPAIALYFSTMSVRPKGCAQIKLFPECVHDGEVHAFANSVSCYHNVTAIDWLPYIYDGL